MANWLLELYSEEIPASMQPNARRDLARLISDGLKTKSLGYTKLETFVTPRRLVAIVHGLDEQSPDTEVTKKGPRLTAPEAAVQGFLRSCNKASLDELDIVRDAKKGDYYQFSEHQKGQSARDLLAALQMELITTFPWPKRMRWGRGTLRWIRPLRSVLSCLETTEGLIAIPLDLDDIANGLTSYGHPRLAPKAFEITKIGHFETDLQNRYVVLSSEAREQIIDKSAKTLTDKSGFELVDDPALLREIGGLVEWPVPLLGRFDEAFLTLPDEVIRASIKTHQKCFVAKNKKTGALANIFVAVANTVTDDQGATIIRGNEKVIHARLSDAVFFWQEDMKIGLDQACDKLHAVLFHAKLGTVAERVQRLIALASSMADTVKLNEVDKEDLRRAAELCKADLVTGMVGEFPELQGLMGSYYAAAQGEKSAVVEAIRNHYRPQGPADSLPRGQVPLLLALVEKMALLADFWSIDEKPSGSRDPFALRRAALGLVRLIETGGFAFDLHTKFIETLTILNCNKDRARHLADDLMAFIQERLRGELKERGHRLDVIEAILAQPTSHDVHDWINRTETLSYLVNDAKAEAALTAIKRVNNILKADEAKTKSPRLPLSGANATFLPEEQALWQAASQSLTLDCASLESLTQPIGHFFDNLMINDPDLEVRQKRLGLLAKLRTQLLPLADFSQLVMADTDPSSKGS